MPQPVAVDLRDYVVFDTERAVRSRVIATDLVAIDMLCLEPGQQLAARTHDESDTVYVVIGGRAWVATYDSEVTLDPLQAVLVPAGTAHGVRNESPDPLLLQSISSLPIATQSLRGTTSNEPETDPDANSSRTSPA
ncbi:MAG: cupin domain-containing protein [Actinobacteria bacterium]|nr:cupin domain-containing protein [Actinomycetota bacterium]